MMSRKPWRFSLALPVALLALSFAGCTAAGLSGSASMRVDVEVYDGPLARSIEAQEAELRAAVEHTMVTFKAIEQEMLISQCRLGCFAGKSEALECCEVYARRGLPLNTEFNMDGIIPTDCRGNESEKESSEKPKEYAETSYLFGAKLEEYGNMKKEDAPVQVCPTLRGLELEASRIVESAKDVLKDADPVLKAPNRKADIQFYRKASWLGGMLRSKGEFWATQFIGTVPDSIRTRIVLVHFTNPAAELGNEILTRSDALIRQHDQNLAGVAVNRRLLPTSLYLRDSGGTDYLNLTDWFNASPRRKGKYGKAEHRVKIIERLITDTHWSKVNTVFASGQGEVRMALIKDDIGNWNLKSFDNDPAELLDAYKQAGLAAVKTAAKIAGDASAGGSLTAARSALNIANRLAMGESGEEVTGLDVQAIHQHSLQRLEALQESQAERAKQMKMLQTAAEGEAETAKGEVDEAREARDSARKALDNKDAEVRAALQALGRLLQKDEAYAERMTELDLARDEQRRSKETLDAQRTENQTRITNQEDKIETLRARRTELKASYDRAEAAYQQSKAALAVKEAEIKRLTDQRNALPDDTVEKARRILSDHSRLIGRLLETAVDGKEALRVP